MGQAQSSLMAKVTPAAHPESSAGGWKGGWLGVGPGDSVSGSRFLTTPSQLQMSSHDVERWPSPVHARMGGRLIQPGKRSCSCALVTPLTNTKRHHSASENKICIYVTPPHYLPQPFPSVVPGVYVTDMEGRWLQAEHLLGFVHSA